MSNDARPSVLARIRAALATEPSTSEAMLQSWQTIPRDYERAGALSPNDKLHLLEDRLRDYDAEVSRVSGDGVAQAIAQILSAHPSISMLVAPGFPGDWRPAYPALVEDHGLTPRELDSFAGVLTTATTAIAETGSLVLQNVPGQGRRAASLVPDFHLCVVRAQDVVENVPEAFARLDATSTLPTTFVSGPSATADIEMTRIKGVHGPRFLHVLLVTEDS